MSDWLKIPWAGASLTSPSRRVLLSPVGLAVLGGGLVAIFFSLSDWTAELLWFRAIGYEGVSGDSASPRSRCLQSPSFLCSSPKVCEPKHQRAA